MIKILRSRRRRWRGVPLGSPPQHGCKFCSPHMTARQNPWDCCLAQDLRSSFLAASCCTVH